MIDPALQLGREDYKDLASPMVNDLKPLAEVSEPPIPDITEILAAPKPPQLGETQQVSIAVTDDVPLKDVFIELARLANVDIEVDAGISGGIDFSAKERPFNEVVDRICNLAGLRYSMKNNVLSIERDLPYVQMYSLDFLNLDRTAASSANISTSVLSSAGANGGAGTPGVSSAVSTAPAGSSSGNGGLNNGSSSTITSTAGSDFWKQFEESVKRILHYKPPRRISEAQATTSSTSDAGDGRAVATSPAVPDADCLNADGNAMAAGSGMGCNGAFYVLNRQAATLTVSATYKQHAMIKEFIKRIQENVSAQVLIEAKIMEVTLNDQSQNGINWTRLGSNKVNFSSAFGGASDTANVATFATGPGNDLESVVKLAEAFGTTRTLSSPRLHAINNQGAILTFADNQVYFTFTVTPATSSTVGAVTTTPTAPTITSTVHTVPIGIILNLQPSIDRENNEVTLSVHPTLSRIVGSVNDPGVAITVAQAVASLPANTPSAEIASLSNITSPVPIVEVRELDSVLKLKNGQVMVIGGLMQDASTNNDTSKPAGASWFGDAKAATHDNRTSELVIFIRATIVGTGSDTADKVDKDVYQKFTRDPRPINF
jgi:general secretion pathway protein D